MQNNNDQKTLSFFGNKVFAQTTFLAANLILIYLTYKAFSFAGSQDLNSNQLLVDWMARSESLSKVLLVWMLSAFWLLILSLKQRGTLTNKFVLIASSVFAVTSSITFGFLAGILISAIAANVNETKIIGAGYQLCADVGTFNVVTKKGGHLQIKSSEASVFQKSCDTFALDFSTNVPQEGIRLDRTMELRERQLKNSRIAEYQVCETRKASLPQGLPKSTDNETYLEKAVFAKTCK